MNIFKLETKIRFKSILVFSIIVAILFFSSSFLYPIMQDMVELIEDKLDIFPPEMLEALHITDFIMFTHPFGVFSYVFQYLYVAICAYVSMMGASILAKEEIEKTIEFLYSKPISRSEIFISKVLSGIVYILFLNLVILILSLIGILIQDSSVDVLLFIKSVVIMIFPQLIMYFTSIAISLLVKNLKSASIISISIVFGYYFLGILSVLHEDLEFLKYFSLINYFNMTDLLYSKISIELLYLFIFIILGIISIVVSYLNYIKRDFKC